MGDERTVLTPEIVSAGFSGGNPDTATGWIQPSAFIQWKGTDVCMDFHCDCGASCHYDGDFCYTVQCPHCGQTWEMPYVMYPRKVTPETYPHDPKILEPDEERCDYDGKAQPLPTPPGCPE